jgi:DNA-directed RNA polymerase subunit RPC12/RpoP
MAPENRPWQGFPGIIQQQSQGSFTQDYRSEDVPELYRLLLGGLDETPSLDPLKERDPGFNETVFFQRILMIIEAVRLAESSGQLDMARPFLSLRFFRRWQPWAAGLRRAGFAHSSNITRQSMPIAMHSEAAYDQVTFRVVEVDNISKQPPALTRWSFLRSAAGRSDHQTEYIAAVCTNCGAPVDATNQAVCRYCGAGVAVLGPEWVLDDVAPDTARSASAA